MILALITAGGRGTRMGGILPKQFVSVGGCAVIIHTLMCFQNHPDIDAICVPCLSGWESVLADMAHRAGITKLRHIITGGTSGSESIRLGLNELRRHYHDDDIVLIHDGVRPMVSRTIISDCINVVRTYGTAIAAIPVAEVIMTTCDGATSNYAIARDSLRRTQTPHGFYLGDITDCYARAHEMGITNAVAACDMLVALGRGVHFSVGSEKNIKLTTPDDYDIFCAMLGAGK